MSELRAPAETYTLNVLASSLGRFSVRSLDRATVRQSTELFDQTLAQLGTGDTPPVPHTDRELLRQAHAFDQKLIDQMEHGPSADHLGTLRVKHAKRLLRRHATFCDLEGSSNSPQTMLAEPQAIADAYGLPDLWNEPLTIVNGEIARYGQETQHPEVPKALQEKVSLAETKSLLSFMWSAIIKPPETPQVDVYMTDKPQDYHVFWAPTADRLDYATPNTYDRATQLSFDLPHNAMHLAHLALLREEQGVARYDDSMAQRAYFEAMTVFSEYKTMELASNTPEFGVQLSKVFNIDTAMSPEELGAWVVADRQYEFKLRAVRLHADALMIQGLSFEDAVPLISQKFNIPLEHARAETAKYLPWTGLGGVYTHGYRKLLEEGHSTVQEALHDTDGTVKQTWIPQ